MNKTLSLLTMLLIAGSVTFANAFDNPMATSAVFKKGSTVKLLYKGIEQTDVKILIFNDQNEMVFVEKIKNTQGFLRPYNFSNLPQGNYTIELIDDSGRQIQRVNYIKERTKRSKLAYVAHVAGSPDKFVLSVPNEGSNSLTVTIYNEDDQVLFAETQSTNEDFAKIYRLKDYFGTVKFVVTDDKGLSKSMTKYTR